MNASTKHAPSLFDDGHIGLGLITPSIKESNTKVQTNSLVDLLHDGFYIVFLLKNNYVPADAEAFRENIMQLLDRFENTAKKLLYVNEDIQDAKYAYCALLDETIITQQDAQFFELQNHWMMNPLQLSLFGSQLAGYRFFEHLEEIRAQDKQRLDVLEFYHYCLLLGFHGKYRIESVEHLNTLVTRVSDQIDYLKGKKPSFSPFSQLPDRIKHILHRELPLFWIIGFWVILSLSSFICLHYMLDSEQTSSLANFQNIISAPLEQAYITIHLP